MIRGRAGASGGMQADLQPPGGGAVRRFTEDGVERLAQPGAVGAAEAYAYRRPGRRDLGGYEGLVVADGGDDERDAVPQRFGDGVVARVADHRRGLGQEGELRDARQGEDGVVRGPGQEPAGVRDHGLQAMRPFPYGRGALGEEAGADVGVDGAERDQDRGPGTVAPAPGEIRGRGPGGNGGAHPPQLRARGVPGGQLRDGVGEHEIGREAEVVGRPGVAVPLAQPPQQGTDPLFGLGQCGEGSADLGRGGGRGRPAHAEPLGGQGSRESLLIGDDGIRAEVTDRVLRAGGHRLGQRDEDVLPQEAQCRGPAQFGRPPQLLRERAGVHVGAGPGRFPYEAGDSGPGDAVAARGQLGGDRGRRVGVAGQRRDDEEEPAHDARIQGCSGRLTSSRSQSSSRAPTVRGASTSRVCP